MMGTKIFKINAEMAEKIEVEVGTKNIDIIIKFGRVLAEKTAKNKVGVFWNPQDLLLMMGTEIFNFDAS